MGLREKRVKERLLIDDNELKRLRGDGLTYSEIAKRLKVGKNSVANRCRKLRIKLSRKIMNEVTHEELYDMYVNKQMSKKKIAKFFNCSVNTVNRRLIELGVANSKLKKVISMKELNTLYLEKKLSIRKISKVLNVSEEFVKHELQKNNISKVTRWSHITINILKNLYVDENKNCPEIAKELNCPVDVISDKVYKWNLNAYRTLEKHIESTRRSYQNITVRSQGEKDIISLFPTEFHNDYSAIGHELDLWYPKERVAVEYNGEYWHSSANSKSENHILKTAICENKKIHLINIFERFWKNKEQRLKIINILTNVLSPEKLLPVQGIVAEISEENARKFIRQNNIEGITRARFHIGTFQKDGLLINMLSYNIKEDILNICKFTTRTGYLEDYTILIDRLKQIYHPKIIKVSCNRLYYDGSIFLNIGFKKTGITKADFIYVYGNKSVSRKIYLRNPKKYEKYYQVYDCGRLNLKYTL